jgi:hypothetical protein
LLLVLVFLPIRMLLPIHSDYLTIAMLLGWLAAQLTTSFRPTICRSFGGFACACFLLAAAIAPASTPPLSLADAPYHELEMCDGGTQFKRSAFTLRSDGGELGTACPIKAAGIASSAALAAPTSIELRTPVHVAPETAYRLVLLLATGSYARANISAPTDAGILPSLVMVP